MCCIVLLQIGLLTIDWAWISRNGMSIGLQSVCGDFMGTSSTGRVVSTARVHWLTFVLASTDTSLHHHGITRLTWWETAASRLAIKFSPAFCAISESGGWMWPSTRRPWLQAMWNVHITLEHWATTIQFLCNLRCTLRLPCTVRAGDVRVWENGAGTSEQRTGFFCREPDFQEFLKCLKTCLVGVFCVFHGILALFDIWAENRIFQSRIGFSKSS